MMNGDSVQRDWCIPALFQSADSSCWYLIHEADVNRSYCGSKLSNAYNRSSSVDVKMLRRGGFAASVTPLQ